MHYQNDCTQFRINSYPLVLQTRWTKKRSRAFIPSKTRTQIILPSEMNAPSSVSNFVVFLITESTTTFPPQVTLDLHWNVQSFPTTFFLPVQTITWTCAKWNPSKDSSWVEIISSIISSSCTPSVENIGVISATWTCFPSISCNKQPTYDLKIILRIAWRKKQLRRRQNSRVLQVSKTTGDGTLRNLHRNARKDRNHTRPGRAFGARQQILSKTPAWEHL